MENIIDTVYIPEEMMDLRLINPQPVATTPDPSTEELVTEMWICVFLASMVLSCIGCLCSCFFYHTFSQWRARSRVESGVEAAQYDNASLPRYSTVGGLPTYEEAMEQQKAFGAATGPAGVHLSKLSVGELLDIYKDNVKK